MPAANAPRNPASLPPPVANATAATTAPASAEARIAATPPRRCASRTAGTPASGRPIAPTSGSARKSANASAEEPAASAISHASPCG